MIHLDELLQQYTGGFCKTMHHEVVFGAKMHRVTGCDHSFDSGFNVKRHRLEELPVQQQRNLAQHVRYNRVSLTNV